MNANTALKLQQKLGISIEQIVREEYELIILKRFYGSDLSKNFVFKGGTALRLVYGSPRFSEDLDFSAIAKVNEKKLYSLLSEIADEFEALELVESITKRYTYFGIFKIKEDFLRQNFHIKFEASRRLYSLQEDRDYVLSTISSVVTSLTALVQVITIDEALKEKKAIKPSRVRDVFDLWFIGQKLGKNIPMDFSGFDEKTVRQELNKFLPANDRRLVEKWLEL